MSYIYPCGHLEVDVTRGVIYFHLENEEDAKRFGTVTPVRIQGLPKGIVSQGVIDIRVGSLVATRKNIDSNDGLFATEQE